MLELSTLNRILVVAAHPDDELLGCGGAILHHLYQGDKVRVTIVAEGLTSRESKNKRENCPARAISTDQSPWPKRWGKTGENANNNVAGTNGLQTKGIFVALTNFGIAVTEFI